MLEDPGVFARAGRRQSREEFLRLFPDPVLVIEPFAELDETHFSTLTGEGGAASGILQGVARLRKRPDSNAFGSMITVGRAPNNDIAVGAGSVSKFHAYFMKVDGRLALSDAGSSNGTFVAGKQLRARVERVILEDGVAIQFGKLRATFYSPAAFFDWLRTSYLQDTSAPV
jgi:pSer/pThr/pTyr-binding forkhead associated (FHA) protein